MKIKITNDGKKIYTHPSIVRVNDLNYGNHVGHQTVYEYCHDARVEYFASIGKELNLTINEMEFGNQGLIMSQSAANYLAEMKYGMELDIEVYLESAQQHYFDLSYCIVYRQDQSELAKVLTTMVCFDYEKRKVVPMQTEIFQHLKNSLN